MNDRITAGAASVMASLTAGTALVRWAVHPPARGRHRRQPQAGVVPQAFVHCTVCGVETAATVHGGLVRCTEGHIVEGAAL